MARISGVQTAYPCINGNSLITDVGYENNTHSDSAFCKEYLNSCPDNAGSETMIADGAYSGSENRELAASKNTQLITTALSGKETAQIFAGFTFTEDDRQVTGCPMGNVPVKTTFYPKTGMCRALFARECCEKCPHRGECKAREQKKNYAVHVSANMAERAGYLAKLSTDEYGEVIHVFIVTSVNYELLFQKKQCEYEKWQFKLLLLTP